MKHKELVELIAREFALLDTAPKMREKILNGTASGAAKKNFRHRIAANMNKARHCVRRMRWSHNNGWTDFVVNGRASNGRVYSQTKRGLLPDDNKTN